MIDLGMLPVMSEQCSHPATEALSRLRSDAHFLITAAPERVDALLQQATDAQTSLIAAVYRTSAHLHRTMSKADRRQILALDAARLGEGDLAARLVATRLEGHPPARWSPLWATASQLSGALPARAAAGHDAAIRAVAMTADGRFAVTADEAGEVRLREPATGQRIGRPLRDAGGAGQVAVTVIDERPWVITGSGPEGTVRVWDPATGASIGEILTDAGYAPAMATAVLEDRPVVIAGCLDETVRLWDPATGALAGVLLGAEGPLVSVAAASLDDRPVAVTVTDADGEGDCGTVQVWDLGTGAPIGVPFGQEHEVSLAAVASAGGRLVVATKGWDHTVRIWDAVTGRQVGRSARPWPMTSERTRWSPPPWPAGPWPSAGNGRTAAGGCAYGIWPPAVRWARRRCFRLGSPRWPRHRIVCWSASAAMSQYWAPAEGMAPDGRPKSTIRDGNDAPRRKARHHPRKEPMDVPVYYRKQLVGFIEDSTVDNFRTYGRWRAVASEQTTLFLRAVAATAEPTIGVGEAGRLPGYVTGIEDGWIEVVTVPAVP
ncbi:WD40 repeat domain-containing protein [Planobispora siamensis]|uniref:WD domain-containing protein, G-beta repeat-containing protein n=1 Tax=Planobispora siamensis TaxID=936338 RepID=A0A8J3SND3_9ACTN|nr:hypothetical protein [Planobispora siamensis]GIH97628.1 hypothetical protein Psi01_82580 [Planobispora siamensis]